jgi:hypothetical protein
MPHIMNNETAVTMIDDWWGGVAFDNTEYEKLRRGRKLRDWHYVVLHRTRKLNGKLADAHR